ncbi:addiction module protein [Sulfuricurvum sp.]|uniref:addiction module protein n=1 Tax=Sulfuricurvum sp. TaxID=2025608 RepID=UPI00286DC732|nr:addiction module protein [Sulfuricurvum sp.]
MTALEDKKSIINEQRLPWHADEVKRRIEEYKSGKMETTPLHEEWEEIEEFLNGLGKHTN